MDIKKACDNRGGPAKVRKHLTGPNHPRLIRSHRMTETHLSSEQSPKRKKTRRAKIDARIAERRSNIMPLADFSSEHQALIAEQVSAPKPPPRWISAGGGLAWIESRGWHEWHWQRGIDPGSQRDAMPPSLRQQVIARDGYNCQLCLTEVDPSDLHIDHITPWSKGGRHELDNLQVTHSLCNIKKGAQVVP